MSELDSPRTPVDGARPVAAFLFLLAGLIFAMTAIGGIVRLSGSGLSIPEWPIINGSLLPPFTEAGWKAVYDTYHKEVLNLETSSLPGATPMDVFKTMFWIEYGHRATASLIALAYLGVLVTALRRRAVWSMMGGRITLIGFLILAQAILGGLVVLRHLPAEKVTLHLGMAFILFALTLWLAFRLVRPSQQGVSPNPLRTASWVVIGVVFVQVLLGGLVAGTHAGHMINTWPTMDGAWVPTGMWSDLYEPAVMNLLHNPITVQFMHRWWAVVASLAVIYLAARAMTLGVSRVARWSLRLVVTLIVGQFVLGVYTLLLGVPIWIALAHQLLGLALFGVLTLIAYEATHSVVLTESAQATEDAAAVDAGAHPLPGQAVARIQEPSNAS